MAEIEAFIWYDADGNITACGTPHPSAVRRVEPIASADREVLRLKVLEEEIDRLHETHYIDVGKHMLVPRRTTTADG